MQRGLRAAVSYVPDPSLLALRSWRDIPSRVLGRPHERDFEVLAALDLRGAEVVDVGANRGQTIRSIRLVLDSPRIVAFEPNPYLAEHLRRRHRDDPAVTIHQQAVGAERGEFRLFLPRYGHTVYDTRASLSRRQAESFLDPEWFAGFDPRRAGVEEVLVEVRPLDDLHLDVDVLKFDVEGVAHAAVAGALGTIRRCRPVIIVEDPEPATVAVLEAEGYLACAYQAERRCLTAPSDDTLNTIFVHDEHLERLARNGVTRA